MKQLASCKYAFVLFVLCIVSGCMAIEFDALLNAMPFFVHVVLIMGFACSGLALAKKELVIDGKSIVFW